MALRTSSDLISQPQQAFPQSTAFLQEPSTAIWSSAITPTTTDPRIASTATSSRGSPVTPPQQLPRIPRLRPLADDGASKTLRAGGTSEQPREISAAEWWLTLTPSEPKDEEKPGAYGDSEAMKSSKHGVDADSSPQLKEGRKSKPDGNGTTNGKPVVHSSSTSYTEEDISPLKGHRREYSSDAIDSPTTAATAEDSLMSDHTSEPSVFNGSMSMPFSCKLTPQQNLARIIRRADLGTLATDLDEGCFTQHEFSTGIKHAYSLLQDQIILRGQVKIQLQEAGWQPDADDWVEECHAIRFKDVRDLVSGTLFESWSPEDARPAIQALVSKRLTVAQETQSLRDALRAIPGLCEERERAAASRKMWSEGLATLASLAMLGTGFVLLKGAQ